MHRVPQKLLHGSSSGRQQAAAAAVLCRVTRIPADLDMSLRSFPSGRNPLLHCHACRYSTEPGKRPSFFGNLLDNIRQEYSKNKEMQDSLAKFREEAKRLEESEALREARRKFQNIEGESTKSGGAIKEQFSGLTSKIKESVEDLSKHEALKKASEFTESLGKTTARASETLGKAAENISKTNAFQTASSAASTLKEELEGQTLGGRVYRPPKVLRYRNFLHYIFTSVSCGKFVFLFEK
jgi:import inner membrane translocase subunit TIM44